jgi:hypothetical protein
MEYAERERERERVSAELKAAGMAKAGVYKVRKVWKAQGLKAIQPRSFVPKTTEIAVILMPLVPICCWRAAFL